MTPLHLAAFAGSRAVVKDLLDQGADAEERCRVRHEILGYPLNGFMLWSLSAEC